MSCKSQVDFKRTLLRVHASREHNVDKEDLFLELSSVVNKSVVNDLSNQANWRLGVILVKIWHVQVIHKVDERLSWRGSEGSSSSLVNMRLQHKLKTLRVSITVETHASTQGFLLVQTVEEFLDDGGLTSTGLSYEKSSLLIFDVDVENVVLSGGFHGWNDQVLE